MLHFFDQAVQKPFSNPRKNCRKKTALFNFFDLQDKADEQHRYQNYSCNIPVAVQYDWEWT